MDAITGIYVLNALTALAAVAFGWISAYRCGVKKAAVFGYSAWFGMVFITGVYKQSGALFYPEQQKLFSVMDEYIFEISALLLVAWIVGVFIADFRQSREKNTRKEQEKAFPHFKEYPHLTFDEYLKMAASE